MVQISESHNTQYINKDNFIPIQIWYYDKYFRFHFPSIEKSTETEWIFEPFQKELVDKWIKYPYDFYAINKNILFPIPRGCQYLQIVNNKLSPYNTTDLLITAYVPSHIQSPYHDIGKTTPYSIVVFVYPVPNTIPFLIWENIDMNNNIIMNYQLKPNITDQSLLKQISNSFVHYTLYFFENKPGMYWKGTSEYLCIPTNDDSEYPTYFDCQQQIYNKIKNKNIWIHTGSEPIYNYMTWWNKLPKDKKQQSLNENSNDNNNNNLLIFNIIIFFVILIMLMILLYKQLLHKSLEITI